MSEPAIIFRNVWKSYPSYHHIMGGIKSFLFHLPQVVRELRHRRTALEDISFEIPRGTKFGFIGRNGAGKSTTLGLIAGVLSPDSGEVVVNGRISPLLELGAGFHPEMTGRENIMLNGVLLGLTKAEVLEYQDKIIEFSELNEFIDQPVRTYSSGMFAKLGFAVVSILKPDILLLDEILSVGDEAFKRKSEAKFREFQDDPNVTMVLVSHSLDSVVSVCEQAAWIENKTVRMIGPAKDVVKEYQASTTPKVTVGAVVTESVPTQCSTGYTEKLFAEKQRGEVMDKNVPILVAGHTGLVGSAIERRLRAGGYDNLLCPRHAELDLTDKGAVFEYFKAKRPQYVFLAAAKVGGIQANQDTPAEFIDVNLAIAHNAVSAAQAIGIDRLLFLGSSCIYPRMCPQPIKESYLMTGPLEMTNRPYALAKIAGIDLCWAFNRQYGTHYLAVMPTNLFGPGDNYEPRGSHVLPALIRKMHEGKINNAATVEVWGTGSPLREFLYSDDLADACVTLMELDDTTLSPLFGVENPPLVNIGFGVDMTIGELAKLVAEIIGFKGELVFDHTHADGTPQKLLDSSLIRSLGWKPKTTLREGIRLAYEDFLSRSVRM